MGYLRKRFSEPSSWAGLAAVIASAAQAYATRDPQALAATIAGAAAILVPEKTPS